MYNDSKYLIFKQNLIVGYTTSWREADDICRKNSELTWDIPSIHTQQNINQLEQVNIMTNFSDLIESLINQKNNNN